MSDVEANRYADAPPATRKEKVVDATQSIYTTRDQAFATATVPANGFMLGSHVGAVRSSLLVAVDTVGILCSFVAAYFVAGFLRSLLDVGVKPIEKIPDISATLLVGGLPLILFLALSAAWGHYSRRLPFWTEIRDASKAVIYSAAIVSLTLFAIKGNFSRFWAVSFFATLLVVIPVCRLLSRSMLRKLKYWAKPTIVIGDGPLALAHAQEACNDRYMGLQITKYIDITSHSKLNQLASQLRYHKLGLHEFDDELPERPHIIVAVQSMNSLSQSKRGFDAVMGSCAAMTFIPPISGIPLYNSQLIQGFGGDVAILRLHNNLKRKSAKAIKRTLDILMGGAALIILSPVFFIITALVKVDGGPAVFGHERIGSNGRKFKCLKFRSMQIDADNRLRELLHADPEARESWEKNHKLKDDPRITKTGQFLRKTSLDELPQFWNVLKGEMSVIGPRPIVQAEVVKYGSDYNYYCEAKPGITGLWQISGRNDTTYNERVSLDVWYVRNWSPWLDMEIALKTIPILLFGKGAY